MTAKLNPKIIEWAVQRSGLTENVLIKKFPKFMQWLNGTWNPTVKQLNELAALLHVHLYELFADKVPDYSLQIADFRTITDKGAVEPSPELYDTIDAMVARQDWMRSYFNAEGYGTVTFVGSYANKPMMHETAIFLASEMHRSLDLDEAWARQSHSVSAALKVLKNQIETMGISVVVNGVVGDNSHRPLDVKEFRGFALADAVAPVIFINGQDTKSAQIFTLIHELCHLAYAQTGVSNSAEDSDFGGDVEGFCNTVSAEFLVPEQLLRKEWDMDAGDNYHKIRTVAAARKVNCIVVARKAKDLGLIGTAEFYQFYKRYKSELPREKKNIKSGGNYIFSKQYRLGSVFSDAVYTAVNTNYLNYRDAYDLTGMKAPAFKRYFEEAV
ncbi:MAG: ImmA/IrrE family metallo-endopeptidase [Eggerthellaceae bacterium]|jgi:Zn-dependent peptidase ImmA (M78 family)|nr:ImmA/IrrE family metallo-endopeptidase [Eggerthellaceae bacterium]MCH4220674.1 ImmA/IrrE family metallo-endopeptidase [Eggerthellaceae bacterium]